MENDIRNSLNRLKGTIDKFLTTLAQNLYLYIIRNLVFRNQLTQEIVLDL